MKVLIGAVLALVLFAKIALAVDYPHNTGFVTDAAQILSGEEKADLENELRNYESKTGTEIAILIVKNTGDKPAPDYAIEIANSWGIGKKGVDNGALLLVAMETHKIFMAVGRQLEGALTDSQAADVCRNVISPRFKEGRYYAGLKEGILATERTIAGEKFTDKRTANKGQKGNDFATFSYLLFLFVGLVSWLASILGRSKEIWPGGASGAVIGALLAWFVSSSVITILAIGVVSGLVGLAFDWIVSSNYKSFTKGGPTPPWWMGGGSSFGGSSSGGFGGGSFSGGGGGSDW